LNKQQEILIDFGKQLLDTLDRLTGDEKNEAEPTEEAEPIDESTEEDDEEE